LLKTLSEDWRRRGRWRVDGVETIRKRDRQTRDREREKKKKIEQIITFDLEYAFLCQGRAIGMREGFDKEGWRRKGGAEGGSRRKDDAGRVTLEGSSRRGAAGRVKLEGGRRWDNARGESRRKNDAGGNRGEGWSRKDDAGGVTLRGKMDGDAGRSIGIVVRRRGRGCRRREKSRGWAQEGSWRRRGKGCRQRESRSRRLPREKRERVRWRGLKGEGPRVVAGEEQMRRVAREERWMVTPVRRDLQGYPEAFPDERTIPFTMTIPESQCSTGSVDQG
jgi:hypothetical protein